jgi:tRNA (guanine-N7-)-methyltransferase
LDRFFAEGEVEEIWIVHPDPRPKGADARRRLTHPRFLAMYEQILIPG